LSCWIAVFSFPSLYLRQANGICEMRTSSKIAKRITFFERRETLFQSSFRNSTSLASKLVDSLLSHRPDQS
jgi:hypothetical protein